MIEPLRDKLIRCGWVTNFNADTLVRLIERHYAALAQPEPEGPTLDDIWELCEEHGFVLGIDGANEEESVNVLWEIARAVLARWGRPAPQPPVDGEVAELVEWLREASSVAVRDGWPNEQSINLTRTASLLERLSPPQPVPVSERLPGPEDCDEEGRCWFGGRHRIWMLMTSEYAIADSCWLPYHALPLPSSMAY